MKQFNYLLIILFISILFQSCREDVDIIDITPPNIPPVIKVESSILGNVTDQDGNAINGALVTFENHIEETDENGIFQFLNEKLNKNGTFISVKKDGYFVGSRRFYPTAGNTSLLNIELLKLEIIGSFASDNQSTISHQGVNLDFPKESVVNEDGTDYIGEVNVAVAYLDPTYVKTLNQMPGDLTGLSENGNLMALKSLGMFAVELMDDNGVELQVKAGHKVGVKIPIPAILRETAPETIPMWHFDETKGIWVEEGEAALVGDSYETDLAHFSFWNCDISDDFIFLKGSIINRGVPLQGVTVMILDVESNTSGYGVTDENGMFCGFVPENEQLTIIVYNQCGAVVYSGDIGPFSEDTILDPINLNLSVNFATISGTASYCNGDLSEYAYVMVQQGILNQAFPILEDNTFTGNMFYCLEDVSIAVSAVDPIIGVTSGVYNYTIEGDLDIGNIELCDEGLVEHIIIEYGDVVINVPFDDDLFLIVNYLEYNVITGENDNNGFLIRALVGENQNEAIVYKFAFNYQEGIPEQLGRVELWDSGFFASGNCSSQLVWEDGKEYVHTTGTLSDITILNEDLYDESNTSIYFDILVENK